MKFNGSRESILKPLQAVIGVVERRQTMAILSHVLLRTEGKTLNVTATDLEVELVAETAVDSATAGEVTVPGRKLYEICRALPEGCRVEVSQSGDRLTLKAGRSRFTLSTLAASDFPIVEGITGEHSLKVGQKDLHWLIEKTQFSMAQQDVRYYLNGLLLETEGKTLRAVATDGHRLALAEVELAAAAGKNGQVIVPRKGVLELNRLLDGEDDLSVVLGSNHIRVDCDGVRLTSKLIDGRFPDYERVIPSKAPNVIKADRELLRHALQRTGILSNEKYRGVRLELDSGTVTISANNPEQEEATETVELQYQGDKIEIGFNVNYLLEALAAADSGEVELHVTDGNSSCLIISPGVDRVKYVVMPMRL
ncbi:MAG TPA: DNA polymerase III subunit beta [Gammaproteobacteria bacterium]|nr:DNA polymerase III subunit beta [Gammaproteobacteria bacterium]